MASNADETCFRWSKDSNKGCSLKLWEVKKKTTKQSQSLEFAAGYWTCAKKIILTPLALLCHTVMLENVDISPYKNEYFEDSKQRYILITPATFVPKFAKQGSVVNLIKLHEWCLIPVW